MARTFNEEGLELARAINLRLVEIRNWLGSLDALETTDKDSLVAAVNEIRGLIPDGPEGTDLTSGPVTSSGGVSAIANNALTISMTSGLQTALDGKATANNALLTGTFDWTGTSFQLAGSSNIFLSSPILQLQGGIILDGDVEFLAGGTFTYGTGMAAAHRTALELEALATVTPGTGVATALAVNIGSAGAPVLFNGALGTPTSGVLTNCTSIPAGQLTGLIDIARLPAVQTYETIGIACSDMTTVLTTGEKVAFDMPYDFTVRRVYASLAVAPTVSALTLDVEDEGTSLLNAVLSIGTSNNNAETSTFAAAASTYALTKGDRITIDIDSVGSSNAGLIVFLEGIRS